MDARTVYTIGLALIFIAVGLGGVADFVLFVSGKDTVTDYLRANPALFVIPAVIMVEFLFALALHLYTFRH
jgi:hypothetical protein